MNIRIEILKDIIMRLDSFSRMYEPKYPAHTAIISAINCLHSVIIFEAACDDGTHTGNIGIKPYLHDETHRVLKIEDGKVVGLV